MAPKLKISECLMERLNEIKTQTVARLYGMIYSGNLLVIGIRSNQQLSLLEVPFNFATEVDLCGAVVFKESEILEPEAIDVIKDVDITDNPILLNCGIGRSNVLKAHFYIHGKLEKAKFDIVSEEDLWNQFVHVRVFGSLPLHSELTSSSVKDNLAIIHKKITAGLGVFRLNSSPVYLMNSDVKCPDKKITENSTIQELYVYSDPKTEGGGGTNAKKKKITRERILTVELFLKPISESDVDLSYAPVIHYSKKNFKYFNCAITIDTLSILHLQTKVVKLYEILIESICRNLRLSEQSLLLQFTPTNTDPDSEEKNPEIESINCPVPYHFIPNKCGHFVTVVYPASISEDSLKEERSLLHGQFFLPLNRPCFRRRNAFIFPDDSSVNEKLVNPHLDLKSPMENAEIYSVKGKYTYYHYMQDGMDDDGWGCAYRSLQTLCSWFWWQGYTDKVVPTHREIQECLARIGDKPITFVNSKQWIGSTEVSYVLDSLFGVQSRIINVSSGNELATIGSQLAVHFTMQGSPIMIGGGVLAHTILGVAINKQSGDVKFLVLDPHYKGSDELQLVLSKGWCSWKSADFWKANAFYNLCLPQVPHCF